MNGLGFAACLGAFGAGCRLRRWLARHGRPCALAVILALPCLAAGAPPGAEEMGPPPGLSGPAPRASGHGEDMGGAADARGPGGASSLAFDGREIDLQIPARLPPAGQRALLVVLHGGMGNSRHIREGLGLDGLADQDGFLVAYLNGTPLRRDARRKTRNAGACCGLAQRRNVDDMAYITAAIRMLTQSYGVDPARVYGVGHSNGAMMTLRVMCETGVYAAAVSIAGALEVAVDGCPAARGKRILAIHGADDVNVPVAGGRGQGAAGVAFRSEADTRRVFERSGTTYHLTVVPGAGHRLAELRAAYRVDGKSLTGAIASFLGLGGGVARH